MSVYQYIITIGPAAHRKSLAKRFPERGCNFSGERPQQNKKRLNLENAPH